MIVLTVISGIVGGLLLLAAFVWFNNDWLKTTRYEVEMPVSESVKIVHLSDLHGKRFGRRNARLVKKIVREKPDFIAFTGDIVHLYRPKDREVALELVSTLSAIAPFYYVSGNHEMRNKGYRFLRRDLEEAGAVVLDDRSCAVCGVTLVGLNCASLKNDKIFQVTPDGENKILLAHMPQFLDQYAAAGYDLVLCGHAHGGQWRLPFTKIGVYAPGQGLFPKYTSGMIARGKTRVVISRGLGNSECPLRLFNRPEMVVITLAPANKRKNP